jgi:predicted small lipoprotein YifL
MIVLPGIKILKGEAMRTIGIMLLLTLFLQGCGRKGQLFLSPLPTATPQAAPAQPTTDKPESKK